MNAPLDHAAIAARIPHQGAMCLLERVVAWDAAQIHAIATNHRALDNPLRAQQRLGIAAGIEYAAQAMAVHGALMAENATNAANAATNNHAAPQVGYLASVRGVEPHVARLDDIAHDLQITAQRLSGDARNVLYAFAIHADSLLLLRGRAAVVLTAEMPA